jgi:transcriptional regulator with XRE-family HTH domain
MVSSTAEVSCSYPVDSEIDTGVTIAAPMSDTPSTDGFTPPGGPALTRILVGTRLRRLREASGISREAAGEAIRASHAKIGRLELGRVGLKERDVADLLTLYGVIDERERAAFLELTRQANAPGWWHLYADVVPTWFETYLGVERSAATIVTYEVQFVPGLLQTEAYARAVTLLRHQNESAAQIARRIQLRMARQELLAGPGAPSLVVVLDETALRRPLGSPEVMRAQLHHLIELTELPNLTFQVLPFRSGGHAGVGAPFTILRFAEPDVPDLVYLEQLTGALYVSKSADVDRYAAVIDRLRMVAETPAETVRFVHSIINDM